MRRTLVALLCLTPVRALATPHALPFSYPYATLGQGALEIEQYADLTPSPMLIGTGAGGRPLTQTALRAVMTTEIEYGLTDRLEGGFYLQGSNDTTAPGGTIPARIDGIKQRLRYRFADPGVLPIDVSVYGEVSEFVDEIELEAKVNLEKRIGRLQLLVNLWAEREFYYSGVAEWVVNPTAGASFQISPAFQLGLEYWGHGEFGGDDPPGAFNPQFHHYLGPALLLQTGRIWLAAAPYVRLDHLGRAPAVGDEFGPVWVRTILGLEF